MDSSQVIRIDKELLAPMKIQAIQDGVSLTKWLSDVVRRELNERQKTALAIKPAPASQLRTNSGCQPRNQSSLDNADA